MYCIYSQRQEWKQTSPAPSARRAQTTNNGEQRLTTTREKEFRREGDIEKSQRRFATTAYSNPNNTPYSQTPWLIHTVSWVSPARLSKSSASSQVSSNDTKPTRKTRRSLPKSSLPTLPCRQTSRS
ncbi:unnamed protein product [Chondrus crispus]|uniref:Uncharacterized protein n=1 Tax=Chondrus crispus TaxID=2769 RepID=R7Q1X0_CHOCR|nr:unnamed protein product [Chondrus crispus]CDF32577.1 unnamed protein product [Chondrus crispus]|eukprot:XP_005712242.1 unnamed protein product [Chondrus crispus]